MNLTKLREPILVATRMQTICKLTPIVAAKYLAPHQPVQSMSHRMPQPRLFVSVTRLLNGVKRRRTTGPSRFNYGIIGGPSYVISWCNCDIKLLNRATGAACAACRYYHSKHHSDEVSWLTIVREILGRSFQKSPSVSLIPAGDWRVGCTKLE